MNFGLTRQRQRLDRLSYPPDLVYQMRRTNAIKQDAMVMNGLGDLGIADDDVEVYDAALQKQVLAAIKASSFFDVDTYHLKVYASVMFHGAMKQYAKTSGDLRQLWADCAAYYQNAWSMAKGVSSDNTRNASLISTIADLLNEGNQKSNVAEAIAGRDSGGGGKVDKTPPPAPEAPKRNLTPWLIGGGVAVAAVGGYVLWRRSRKSRRGLSEFIPSGYRFHMTHGRSWGSAKNDAWEIEVGGKIEGELVGFREIDGTKCAVIKVKDRGFFAVTAQTIGLSGYHGNLHRAKKGKGLGGLAGNFYVSTFCNFAHNKKTGRPIGHECVIIPPAALKAEMAGDYDKANAIMQRKRAHGALRVVRGRK